MKRLLIVVFLPFLLWQCQQKEVKEVAKIGIEMPVSPFLKINGQNTHKIVNVYRMALGDVFGNIQAHQSGLLEKAVPCLYAGLDYGKPWTRDAAINVWNGFGLLAPNVAKNTLMAQLETNDKGKTVIIGQYWDQIIWGIGAWNYYLYTGDKAFLELAFQATQNSLQKLEEEEFSEELNLFRGAAVYGDGVAAYPRRYTNHKDKKKIGSYSGIYEFAKVNPDLKADKGYGLPMHALSTNCVYAQVYNLLPLMAEELGVSVKTEWNTKGEKLRKAINDQFWMKEKGSYRYLVDPFGNCDFQEGMGISFALLFGIADQEQKQKIFENIVVEPMGIPCVYPSFDRFRDKKLDSYGRHSGTVWPHVQGFWADAAKKNHHNGAFLHEFKNLTEHAFRDKQFVEIYHPKTGLPYGGLQEPHLKEKLEWFCGDRQTWSATAYLRMFFMDIVGMEFSRKGVSFAPYLPSEIHDLALDNLKYRQAILNIHIKGKGTKIQSFKINGQESKPFFAADQEGEFLIEIEVGNS